MHLPVFLLTLYPTVGGLVALGTPAQKLTTLFSFQNLLLLSEILILPEKLVILKTLEIPEIRNTRDTSNT